MEISDLDIGITRRGVAGTCESLLLNKLPSLLASGEISNGIGASLDNEKPMTKQEESRILVVR